LELPRALVVILVCVSELERSILVTRWS